MLCRYEWLFDIFKVIELRERERQAPTFQKKVPNEISCPTYCNMCGLQGSIRWEDVTSSRRFATGGCRRMGHELIHIFFKVLRPGGLQPSKKCLKYFR